MGFFHWDENEEKDYPLEWAIRKIKNEQFNWSSHLNNFLKEDLSGHTHRIRDVVQFIICKPLDSHNIDSIMRLMTVCEYLGLKQEKFLLQEYLNKITLSS